jgi:hypothetical protein
VRIYDAFATVVNQGLLKARMEEALSPFDHALNRPFLDQQPIVKRWSLFSQSTAATTTSMSSSSVSDNSARDESTGRKQLGQSGPAPIEEIVFATGQDIASEEEGAFVLALAIEEGRVVDPNEALMRERHQDISHIRSEMQQLNQIQRGSLCSPSRKDVAGNVALHVAHTRFSFSRFVDQSWQ